MHWKGYLPIYINQFRSYQPIYIDTTRHHQTFLKQKLALVIFYWKPFWGQFCSFGHHLQMYILWPHRRASATWTIFKYIDNICLILKYIQIYQAGLSNLGSFVIWSDSPRVVPPPTRPSPVFRPSRRWSRWCLCCCNGWWMIYPTIFAAVFAGWPKWTETKTASNLKLLLLSYFATPCLCSPCHRLQGLPVLQK